MPKTTYYCPYMFKKTTKVKIQNDFRPSWIQDLRGVTRICYSVSMPCLPSCGLHSQIGITSANSRELPQLHQFTYTSFSIAPTKALGFALTVPAELLSATLKCGWEDGIHPLALPALPELQWSQLHPGTHGLRLRRRLLLLKIRT